MATLDLIDERLLDRRESEGDPLPRDRHPSGNASYEGMCSLIHFVGFSVLML
jgi:hypothetical protein